MCCKLMSVMKLEFVDSQMSGLLFRLLECLSIFGVKPLQPRLVNSLDDTLMQAGQPGNFLVRVSKA